MTKKKIKHPYKTLPKNVKDFTQRLEAEIKNELKELGIKSKDVTPELNRVMYNMRMRFLIMDYLYESKSECKYNESFMRHIAYSVNKMSEDQLVQLLIFLMIMQDQFPPHYQYFLILKEYLLSNDDYKQKFTEVFNTFDDELDQIGELMSKINNISIKDKENQLNLKIN